MHKLLLIILVLLSLRVSSQISGNVKLLGQNNHEGIKILFIAASLTAVSDSSTTDINGNYTKILAAGVYNISFSKSGYVSYQYKNTFVNGSITLGPVRLLSTLVKEVSGTVSGIWHKDTIYAITDVITIPENDSLVVEPGVSIYLSHELEYVRDRIIINVNGKLVMRATHSEFIKIIPAKTDDTFNYISFATKDNAIFDFIDCSTAPFYVINSNGGLGSKNIISNSRFFRLSMSLNGCNDVFNNIIYGAGFPYVDGSLGKSNISCNLIYGSVSFGYYDYQICRHSLNIHHNYFDVYMFYAEQSLATYDTSTVFFNHNLIRNFSGKIRLINNGARLEFNNNTNKDTSYVYIEATGKYNQLQIVNNILGRATVSSDGSLPLFDFTKNLFYDDVYSGNFKNIAGVGIPIITDAKGVKFDTYLNIVAPAPTIYPSPIHPPVIGAGVNGTDVGFNPKGTCMEGYFKSWTIDDDTTTSPSPDSLKISGDVLILDVIKQGIQVKAINSLTLKTYKGLTDQFGHFVIDSLPIGKYIIEASPSLSLSGIYQTTYYPKKARLDLADTIDVHWNISNMKIYLIASNTSLDDQEYEDYIGPNPFSDLLVINNFKNETIQIYDLTARIVYESNSKTTQIDTKEWPKGFYFIKSYNKVLKFTKE